MCACGSKDKAHEDTKTTNKETETTLAQTETTKDLSEKSKSTGNTDSSKFIEWKYDITHDGVDDTIKVSIDPANYQSLEEPRFEVYSGKTEKKIWEKDISSSHMGFDGLYLYNDGEKDHLLEWQPGMYQGNAVYSYKIFDLSETGEQNVIETDNIGFSVKENLSDGSDSSVLGTFIDKVNQYLNKSFVLIDTNDNGFVKRDQIIYSTTDNEIVLPYDATEELKNATQIIY